MIVSPYNDQYALMPTKLKPLMLISVHKPAYFSPQRPIPKQAKHLLLPPIGVTHKLSEQNRES